MSCTPLPPPHPSAVPRDPELHRAAADLHGAAGRAARHRRVTRPLKRSDRALAHGSSNVATLGHRASDAARATERAAVARSRVPAGAHPRIRPRTLNAIVVLMALCDTLLVASALQHADDRLSPLLALILAAGIGTALVALGKKLGHELATFERLRDQSARWGVIVAISTVIVVIATLGLTLLRIPSTLAWPFLALAAPCGSAALAWYGYDPALAASIDADRRAAQASGHARGADCRATAALARHVRLRDLGERRFRALMGPALRRAIVDGLIAGGDPTAPGRVLDALVTAMLPEPRIDLATIESTRLRAVHAAELDGSTAALQLDAPGGRR